MMPMRSLLLLIILASAVAAEQEKWTVDQLEKFVKSALQLHQNDREVAAYLKRVKLTERLSDQHIEEIRAFGAPPRIMDAVRQLRDASSSLPEPAAPKATAQQFQVQPTALAPPPDSVEQARVLAETREYAANYISKLPDFICAQVT